MSQVQPMTERDWESLEIQESRRGINTLPMNAITLKRVVVGALVLTTSRELGPLASPFLPNRFQQRPNGTQGRSAT